MVSKRGIYTTTNFKDDEELVDKQGNNSKPTRKSRTKVSLSKTKHHEPVELPFCGTCLDEEHHSTSRTDKNYAVCKASFNNLDHAQHMLLHWHAKLDHVNFIELMDVALRGYIYNICARAKPVKCPACQQGKSTVSKTDKNNKIKITCYQISW